MLEGRSSVTMGIGMPILVQTTKRSDTTDTDPFSMEKYTERPAYRRAGTKEIWEDEFKRGLICDWL